MAIKLDSDVLTYNNMGEGREILRKKEEKTH